MKLLIFSDSHLTDKFDYKKYQILVKIIKRADQVIINGDFWDGCLTTFDQFITSPWKKLFPILKGKHAVYIYGNHDRKHYADDRVNLFSDIQTQRFTLRLGNQSYIFHHGDGILTKKMEVITRLKLVAITIHHLDKFTTRHLRMIKRICLKPLNKWIKKKLPKRNSSFFFFGHTHQAEIDHGNRFYNSGFFNHGLAQYLEIQDNIISHQETYY
jgi:predicted phosphodiesterase